MALDMTTALTINARVNGQQAISGLTNGLNKVQVSTNGTATAMTKLRSAASGAFGLVRQFLPVLGVAAFGKFAQDNLNAADAMSKMSDRTGIAVPQLDKFRQVADLSDTSIESLGKAFPVLSKNIVDAANGTGPAADAFDQLGVKLKDASGNVRATDDVMKDIMDRFSQMEDGTQKAALASEIFGRRLGSELIPFLNSGSEAVDRMSTALTQDFADGAARVNDKVAILGETFAKLGVQLIEVAFPAIEALIDVLSRGLQIFQQLPQPVQNIAVGFTALAAAVAVLAPVIGPVVAAFKALAALKLAATLAGWVGAIGPVIAAFKALATVVVAAIGGPTLGIIALVAAAGVAIYVFRDKIADAFKAIGRLFVDLAKAFDEKIVRPIGKAADAVVRAIVDAFKTLTRALRGPFDAIGRFIKFVFNGYIGVVEKFINGAISGINKLVAGANRALSALKLPNIPMVTEVRLPRFAAGGVVDKPTVALVGEGREREYIVPESKMGRAALNYLMGKRGDAVLRNEGGRTGRAGASQGNTTIQLNTGPVLQQDGQRYVTIEDLERSLTSLAANLLGNSRSYAGRRYQGLA